jgi:hypothetical protein
MRNIIISLLFWISKKYRIPIALVYYEKGRIVFDGHYCNVNAPDKRLNFFLSSALPRVGFKRICFVPDARLKWEEPKQTMLLENLVNF